MILANKDHVHRRDRIGFMSNTHQKPTIFIKGLTLHVLPKINVTFVANLDIMLVNIYLRGIVYIS